MTVKQVTPPSVEPVLLVALKENLRILHSAQDNLLQSLLIAARQRAEAYTRRAFVTSTWEATWSRIPCKGPNTRRFYGRVLELPRASLISVAWVKYLDEDGVQQTFDAANYTVDIDSVPGRIVLNPDASWPCLGDYPNAIRVNFTAGYGAAAANVPEVAKLAIKFLASHFYANPAPVVTGTIATPIPDHVKSLLNDLRVEGFGQGDEEAA